MLIKLKLHKYVKTLFNVKEKQSPKSSSISKHKEYMDSKILEVKTGVADTASAVSEIYKGSLKRHFGG